MTFYWLPCDTIAIVISGVVFLAGIVLLFTSRRGVRPWAQALGVVLTMLGGAACGFVVVDALIPPFS